MLSTKRELGWSSSLPGMLILVSAMMTAAYHYTGAPGLPSGVDRAAATLRNVAADSGKLRGAYGRLPLYFEANRGQADKGTKFLSRGEGYHLSLSPTEAVLALGAPPHPADANRSTISRPSTRQESVAPEPGEEGGSGRPAIVRMRLVGANPKAAIAGEEVQPAKANYILGKNRHKWHKDIPTYAKVRYAKVYPGIDLVYHGNGRELEYDFVVAAGADPSRIRLAFAGSQKLEVDAAGDLVLGTTAGDFRHHRPHIYQEVNGKKHDVVGGYVLGAGKEVRFRLGAYDHSRPLVIDPVLAYSTFLGGTGDEAGLGIAVDGQGNAYVSGTRPSVRYPASIDYDAFVAKFSPTGALLWVTDVGDVGDDQGRDVAVDATGNAYLTGKIGFEWFGMTMRPGVLLAKLSSVGHVVYLDTFGSQYGGDTGKVVAVDAAGNAYVGGETVSSDFPTTPGAFQRQFASTIWGADGFITKVDAAGTMMIYSTYLGGSDFDFLNGIAIDGQGCAYVSGSTSSHDFPITPGAFQTVNSGGVMDDNGFVSKLSPDGSHLVYSTFLGGKWNTTAGGVAIDAAGNAYVTGETQSDDFPTTPGTVQPNPGDDRNCWLDICTDAYVTKIAPSGAALVYSTYLGGRLQEGGRAIAVDTAGNAYVTGYTISLDFPTVDPFQPNRAPDSRQDAFVAKLNPTGSALVYSSYLGGGRVATDDPDEGVDDGLRIAVDAAGNAYVTGQTHSWNFPTTPGAYQTVFGGGNGDLLGGPLGDAFVAKIGENNAPAATLTAIALNPATVTGGGGSTGTVTLSAAAPADGAAVTLGNSNTAAAIVPASVTVPAGATTATFTVATKAGTTDAAATISAGYGGVTKAAGLTVKAAALTGVTLNPPSVPGGSSSTATVSLNAPAAAAVTVTLTSANTTVATVPASVTVAAGATSAKFTVTTKAVAANTAVTLSAALGAVKKTATLTVTPAALGALTLNPSVVGGGGASTGTVTLNGTAAAPVVVTLKSANAAVASVPASVTIAAGAKSKTFAVATKPVTADTKLALSATAGAVSKSATLTVRAAALSGLIITPATIRGGAVVTGTVAFSRAVAVATAVTLSSSKAGAATVPASVTVAAGATSAKFTVTTMAVAANTAVSIKATSGGIGKTAALTVTP